MVFQFDKLVTILFSCFLKIYFGFNLNIYIDIYIDKVSGMSEGVEISMKIKSLQMSKFSMELSQNVMKIHYFENINNNQKCHFLKSKLF